MNKETKPQYKPVGKTILIEPVNKELKTQSGLHVLDDGQPFYEAKVIASGNGEQNDQTNASYSPSPLFKSGLTILVDKSSRFLPIKIEDKDYKLILSDSILAVKE